MTIEPDVVIVEDDASLGSAVARMLRTAGFQVRVFGSAEEYLGSDAKRRPDCLVCDVSLPGMSGFALVEALTRAERTAPTIFISAYDSTTVRDEAQRLGSYLAKPFTGDALLAAIRACPRASTSA